MNITLHFDITYGFDGLEDGIILYLANRKKYHDSAYCYLKDTSLLIGVVVDALEYIPLV